MRNLFLCALIGALFCLVSCAPEEQETTFPIAEYMDQAFSVFVTDDSYDNWCGTQLILDFNGGQSADNAIIPEYITNLPTIDGVLSPDEVWNPELGTVTWHTFDLEHKEYASGYGDDLDSEGFNVNAPSSGVVDEINVAACFNVAAGVGTLYMAFQWTDPYGSDDRYYKRWRFYRDIHGEVDLINYMRQVSNGWDPIVDHGGPGGTPVDPDFWGDKLYNHGFSSDTLLLVWDCWQDPDGSYNPDVDPPEGELPPVPSIPDFWENGWDVCWQQDGNDWTCKLTPDMGNEDFDLAPQLDLWWWKSAQTNNWWPTEVQEYGYADDYWQTSDSLYNDHGPIIDAGFPCYRYNWNVFHMAPRLYYERPLFKHQEQPKYMYYPENPEWIYMGYIHWGAQQPDKFGWLWTEDPDMFWHQGDEIPAFASLASTLGSTGDVLAKGNLDENTCVWSVELKRLFDPGNDDDANLAQFDYLK
ncbi:MAG TPA: hypothetical protein VM054_02045 [bacterium]|nr:hypothetical protein [bacterium]